MKIESYQAAYTRAYRLPTKLFPKHWKNIVSKDHLFRNVFDSRYLEGKRICLIDLGTEQVSLQSSNLQIDVHFEALCHQCGHAVAVVTFHPINIPTLSQMKEIQNHWTSSAFQAGGEVFGARELCDVAILRLLSTHAYKGKKLRNLAFEEQIQKLQSGGTIPDLFKAKSGFFTPTVFGCISLFGTRAEPSAESIKQSGITALHEDVDLENELIDHAYKSSVLARRGFAWIFSTDITSRGPIAVMQFAMLNFVRHFNNYLCGELNQINGTLKYHPQRAGKLLERTKTLHEEVAYVYDELHDLSLWDRYDLVLISKKIRAEIHWKLNEEVDAGLKKLDGMAALTSEISKIQNKKSKSLVSFTLAAIGVINLLQLIPIWDDYISQKLEVWVPTLTAAAIIVGVIAAHIHHKD